MRVRLGRHQVRVVLAIIAVLGVIGSAPPQTFAKDWQPPRTVYVATTGHTADRLFLDLWREHRTLTGDPITEELQSRAAFTGGEQSPTVQFYENVAFSYDPTSADGIAVQLLDLGRQYLDNLLAESPMGVLQIAAKSATCPASADDCLDVPESDHTVRGPINAFWEESGGVDWLGVPLTEAYRLGDGSYLQIFENGALRLNRVGEVVPLPLGRFAAARQDLETAAIVQPEGVPAYDESLFVPPPAAEPGRVPETVPEPERSADHATLGEQPAGPGPQVGAYQEIVVSLGQQTMWAYEAGAVVKSSLVSTGTGVVPEAVTPVGTFQILTKYDLQDMEGDIDGYYFIEDVPNVMYFDNLGNALHGTYWHNNFGTPMSHGCVNLPLDVAAWIYDWAPLGTTVSVIP